MAVQDEQGELNRIVDGQLWAEFCDALKQAGQQVLRPEVPADAFTRAEGWRYLTRLLRAGLESSIEFADPSFPVFYSLSHESIKIGADNPDNLYQNARLDGRLEYRIRGQRGTVNYLAFSTKAGGYGADGSLAPTGFLDDSELQLEANGSFELILSAHRHPGNWLPMREDTAMLIVRQTFLDRSREQPAKLSIERLDRAARPAPLDPAQFAQQLLGAARFVQGTARLFADWSADFACAPNTFPPQDQARYQQAGGDPTISYHHAYWRLEQGEALVIDVPAGVACESWNLQVDNYWMESLDYRHHRIHVNKHTASYRPDGSARVVVAHADPGVPNWLETAGHREGTLLFRWIRADRAPVPAMRVLAADSLQTDT